MEVRDSYLVLYKGDNATDVTFTVPTNRGAICRMDRQISLRFARSFVVKGPPNLWVCLHGGWPNERDFQDWMACWQASIPNVVIESQMGPFRRSFQRHPHDIMTVSWHYGDDWPRNTSQIVPPPASLFYGGSYNEQWDGGPNEEPHIPGNGYPPHVPNPKAWCLIAKREISRGKVETAQNPVIADDSEDAYKQMNDWLDTLNPPGTPDSLKWTIGNVSHSECAYIKP